MFSCEFCKISKNSFSYRTTPVAASASAREDGTWYMLCSGNIDNDPRYPDKVIVSSSNTASGQTSSKESIKEETY